MASYVGDGYTYNLPLLRNKVKPVTQELQETPQQQPQPVSKVPKKKERVEEDYTVYLEPEDIQHDIKYIPPPNREPRPLAPPAPKDSPEKEIKRLKKIIEKQQKTIDLLIAKYVK
jgi:hypothetical protein